jgi:hypothetical protein
MGKITRLAAAAVLGLALGSVGCQCCSKKCGDGGCGGGQVASSGCAGGGCGQAQVAAAQQHYQAAGTNAAGSPYAQQGGGSGGPAPASYTSYPPSYGTGYGGSYGPSYGPSYGQTAVNPLR